MGGNQYPRWVYDNGVKPKIEANSGNAKRSTGPMAEASRGREACVRALAMRPLA
jgi:hypothetical protein